MIDPGSGPNVELLRGHWILKDHRDSAVAVLAFYR